MITLVWLSACDGKEAAPASPSPPTMVTTTVDFNGLAGTNEVNRGCTYTEDGFTLDFASPCLPSGEFRSIHPPSFRFSDSVSFFNNSQLGITRLTKTDGGTFDLDSIDLDGLNFPLPTTVTFTGTHSDATTVTQSFTTDATFPARQTFTFSTAFDMVTQVTWAQSGGGPGPQLPFHQFDTIVVTTNAQRDAQPTLIEQPPIGRALGIVWPSRPASKAYAVCSGVTCPGRVRVPDSHSIQ